MRGQNSAIDLSEKFARGVWETPIMKRIFPIVGCVPIALITSLAFSAAASPAASERHKTITCPFLKAGRLTFEVPAKLGDLPEIDFDYPAKATLFSFRDGNRCHGRGRALASSHRGFGAAQQEARNL